MATEPSPTAAPSPTVVPTQGYTTWADFISHEQVFINQLEADGNTLTGVDSKDPNIVQILMIWAEKIRADVAGDLIWLSNQRPEPCYKTYYDDTLVVYRRAEASMNDLIESHDYDSYVSDAAAVKALGQKYDSIYKNTDANCSTPQPSFGSDQPLMTRAENVIR